MQFYSNLECNKKINQQMAYIMGFTSFQISFADCISNLVNNLGLLILGVNGFKEMFLFHTVQYQNQNLFVLNPNFWEFWVLVLEQIVTILIPPLCFKIRDFKHQVREI
jgi:hypothetical protein